MLFHSAAAERGRQVLADQIRIHTLAATQAGFEMRQVLRALDV
jgi:hypothetical protein